MQVLESQLKVKAQQVEALQSQQSVLQELDPDKQAEIKQKKAIVEERCACLIIIFVSWFL